MDNITALELIYFAGEWCKSPENWNRLVKALSKNNLENVFKTSIVDVQPIFNELLKHNCKLERK